MPKKLIVFALALSLSCVLPAATASAAGPGWSPDWPTPSGLWVAFLSALGWDHMEAGPGIDPDGNDARLVLDPASLGAGPESTPGEATGEADAGPSMDPLG